MKKTPIYEKVISYVKSEILSKRLVQDDQIPTEMELVKRFNTSRTTINKAMMRLENEGVIYRIQGKGTFVAKSHGEAFEKRKKNGNKVVSLILSYMFDEHKRNYELGLIRGVSEILTEKGYSLMIHFVRNDAEEEISLIRKCNEGMSDGVILFPASMHKNFTMLYDIILGKYPIVIVDRAIEGLPVVCVQSDNVRGGELATQHLLERNYEDIYFLSDSRIDMITSVRSRFYGYCQALKKAGRQINMDHVVNGYAMDGDIYKPYPTDCEVNHHVEILQSIIQKSPEKRVGLFIINDNAACQFVKAAVQVGLDIPNQLGIVGFDDVGYATICQVPLTTIRQDFIQMGRVAAGMLIKQMNGAYRMEGAQFIDVELIKRKSTNRL